MQRVRAIRSGQPCFSKSELRTFQNHVTGCRDARENESDKLIEAVKVPFEDPLSHGRRGTAVACVLSDGDCASDFAVGQVIVCARWGRYGRVWRGAGNSGRRDIDPRLPEHEMMDECRFGVHTHHGATLA